MAPGRPFTRDTTICGGARVRRGRGSGRDRPATPPSRAAPPTSPFSRGTIREYSVLQMTSSSPEMRSSVRGPNRSRQSLLEAAGTAGG